MSQQRPYDTPRSLTAAQQLFSYSDKIHARPPNRGDACHRKGDYDCAMAPLRDGRNPTTLKAV